MGTGIQGSSSNKPTYLCQKSPSSEHLLQKMFHASLVGASWHFAQVSGVMFCGTMKSSSPPDAGFSGEGVDEYVE